jgi:hypothetical protein
LFAIGGRPPSERRGNTGDRAVSYRRSEDRERRENRKGGKGYLQKPSLSAPYFLLKGGSLELLLLLWWGRSKECLPE